MMALAGLMDKIFFRSGSARHVHAAEVDGVFLWIFYFSTACFVVLMGLMVYWVIKYRRKPGTIAPPSSSHNTVLEVTWTILPLGVLGVMFFQGFHGYMNNVRAPAGALEVELTAFQWDWTVAYPGGQRSLLKKKMGDKDVPVFAFPANTPVKMRMKSNDVIHSFYVPNFRSKFDVMPNRYTTYWFQVPDIKPDPANPKAKLKDGTEYEYEDHWLFCAEYCGDSHSEMMGVIRIVSPEIFQRFMGEWGIEGLPPLERGKAQWSIRCASCHTIDGKPGTGPTWKDLYGHEVTFTDGSKVTSEQMLDDEFFSNYIRESILAPQQKIVTGYGPQMSSFQGQLKEEDISALILFMKSLSDKYKGDPAATPAK